MDTVKQQTGIIRRIDDTGVPLLVARLAVGGMFAYLAFNKIVEPIDFMKLTHAYGVLPEQAPFLNITAIAVPWIEMVCAAALLLGVCVRGAALTTLAMLLFFTPLLLMRAWGLYGDPAAGFDSFCAVKFDCGCGTGEVFICAKMIENVLLKIGVLIALFSRSRRFCLPGLLHRRLASNS